MITVLSVIDTGGPGGAETVFLHTATSLDPARFRSVCIVSREGWLADSLRARGATPLIIASSGSLNVQYLRRIMRVARDECVDVIAGHLYGSAIYCGLAGKLLGIPVVSILHGQSDITGRGRLAGLKKLVVRMTARRLVFVSERLKALLRTALGASEKQCAVIPNGVDIGRFAGAGTGSLRSELGLQSDHILVGAIGNIRAPKAYDVFLRAAKLLKDQSPRYRFAIAGQGSGQLYDALMSLRSELGLEREVTFLGLRSDIASILGSLDVYALSSTTEGFSIACIEAMAAGIPVVATRSGGPEEIIEDGHSGLLVPIQDPQSLAAAVAKLASDPVLCRNVRANALARVRQQYTLTTMLDAYERTFRDVVGHDSERID